MTFARTTALIFACCLGAAQLLASPDPLAARVVIVANLREPESIRLAEFYAGARGVPLANIVALPLPEGETITWREFIDEVYQPLQDELSRRGWIEGMASSLRDRLGRKRFAPGGHRLSYLVLCRGVPLRINHDPTLLEARPAQPISPQFNRNEASVDSELSLLAQSGTEITGFVPNPLFAIEHPDTFVAETVVKVSRLDGPTFASARRLVTSALEAEARGLLGRYYVDLSGPHPDGDRWLAETRRQLDEAGFDGDVESTGATFDGAARFDAPVLYFGWYTDSLNGPFAVPGFQFPAGAVALHIHSFSARTLHSDTEGWVGPLVARGVTATVGNVFEPFLQLTHRPDLLLHALRQGWNFGDAACYALPALSWQAVAIGDPLYRPFRVSLEEQLQQPGKLPPSLAVYAVLRRANLMRRDHRTAEARAWLEAELTRRPSLPLGISLAKLDLADGDEAGALKVLSLVASPTLYRSEDWPLEREVAGLLAMHGARASALRVYAGLVRAAAPTAEARKALLADAREAAVAAGESELGRDYDRQLKELSAPLAR